MPASTPDFHPLAPGIWTWQAYDSAVKADLSSTAVATVAGTYAIDPILLEEPELEQLGPVAGIILTNANHQRSAAQFADRFSAPIFGRLESLAELKGTVAIDAVEGQKIGAELEVILIEGAVAGEIALYYPGGGGTLIVGDALINFEPYRFAFLPRKYCVNEKEMRGSLRQLLLRPAERMLFAHGTPILSGATARLRQLLDFDS
jgi:Metallo-beta-lactamase superfamily